MDTTLRILDSALGHDEPLDVVSEQILPARVAATRRLLRPSDQISEAETLVAEVQKRR